MSFHFIFYIRLLYNGSYIYVQIHVCTEVLLVCLFLCFVSSLFQRLIVGLYMYTFEVFDVISNIEPSERGELEISSVNDYYAKSGELQYRMVNGYWGDAGGSIQRYAECSMHGDKELKELLSIVMAVETYRCWKILKRKIRC